jgi:2C-methyl-D-erythritol 2,4-cyclodiphosphate synthase
MSSGDIKKIMKEKTYTYNNIGRTLMIRAFSKEQIRKHFRTSNYWINIFCAQCNSSYSGHIDLDLTKEQNA